VIKEGCPGTYNKNLPLVITFNMFRGCVSHVNPPPQDKVKSLIHRTAFDLIRSYCHSQSQWSGLAFVWTIAKASMDVFLHVFNC
jgi:hypothetical protein